MKDIKELLDKVKNKKLLVIFPHPDDESFSTAGFILLSKNMGYKITLITLTQGGAGKVAINPNGKSLKEVRVEELKKASKLLGIDNLIIKDYDDSKLRNRIGWLKWLEKEIKRINPGVIVTYDHTGVTGHPDHICVSVFIKNILSKNSLNNAILLWPIESKFVQKYVPADIRKLISKPQYFINIKLSDTFRKIQAVFIHKSQRNRELKYLTLLYLLERKEWYHKVDLKKNYPYKYIDFKI